MTLLPRTTEGTGRAGGEVLPGGAQLLGKQSRVRRHRVSDGPTHARSSSGPGRDGATGHPARDGGGDHAEGLRRGPRQTVPGDRRGQRGMSAARIRRRSVAHGALVVAYRGEPSGSLPGGDRPTALVSAATTRGSTPWGSEGPRPQWRWRWAWGCCPAVAATTWRQGRPSSSTVPRRRPRRPRRRPAPRPPRRRRAQPGPRRGPPGRSAPVAVRGGPRGQGRPGLRRAVRAGGQRQEHELQAVAGPHDAPGEVDCGPTTSRRTWGRSTPARCRSPRRS